MLEQVHAYRVLAEVSPKAYLPKLVDGLLSLSYGSGSPEVALTLRAEAVEAARRIEGGAPARVERLCRALDACQATLFALSGRADEAPASAESPMPPFGTGLGWSSDTRDAFLGALPGLETEAAGLREAGRLRELVDVQRRIGIRVALREGGHHYRFEERFTPYFDEGVALARRLPDDRARLARALTDRAMFLVVARTFEPAHADFAEAVALLDIR